MMFGVPADSLENDLSQWISNIVQINDKEENLKLNVGKIVGPPTVRKYEQQYSIQAPDNSPSSSFMRSTSLNDNIKNENEEEFIHYIIVKIPEKVFIDSLDIYETACEGVLLKIEAQDNENNWTCLWQCDQPHQVNQQRLFRPTITPTSFKCDTLKLTLSNSLHLIDAIEVKGSKKAVLKRGFSTENEQATTYGELPKQMSKLVANELFADVFFEVEGKRVPAHRNILSCRSDYFGAMLSSSANFRESNKQSPIYIPNVKYDVFIQVLSFLYTGHVDIWKLSYCDGLDLIRTADLFNLTKLEELILFTIGERLDKDNIVIIFREAHEKLPILNQVIELCYDNMPKVFPDVVSSKEFCALSQDLMLKILNNVVPKLPKSEEKEIGNTNYRSRYFVFDSSDDD